jgi:hypothetical protein
MATAKKPTAQQKAQAKARAGGNNPIKVTKAGVKRLGKAALIAASVTPAGRGVKAASMAVKAASKVGSAARANARGLKAANKPSLAPKNYKPDTAGRAEVKRYAAPLKDFNGNKRANKLAAGAVDAGRSAMKIKKAPVNKGK